MQSFSQKAFRVLIADDVSDIHQDIRKILSWDAAPATNLQRLENALFDQKESLPATTFPHLRIDSAYQGAEAIEMVERALQEGDPYHLIFMDVRMPPGMDGVEATQKIWNIQPDVNIVICTAYSDYSIDAILSKLGISDKMLFLTKPFSAAVLKQSAITMLRKWDLDNQLKFYTKNLESRVTEQTALLLQASKMAALGEMAAGIAHEVNTPLCVIKLVAQQVKDLDFDPEKAEKSIETIGRMVERIAKIISALKAISRNGQGDPFQPVALNNIIEDVMALCLERFANAGIELGIPEKTDLVVECRAVEISQVMLNLLNNAFDAVSELPEKWVRIEIGESTDTVQIKVIDSGCGVTPNLSDKIFSPFFTTKEIGKGTGLGLSVTRGLVEGHNGSITLDSTAKNTTFVISLPKRQRK